MNRLSFSQGSPARLHISIDTDAPSLYMARLLTSEDSISPDSEELALLRRAVTGLALVVSANHSEEICFHYKIQGKRYLRFDARNYGHGWRITAIRRTPLK